MKTIKLFLASAVFVCLSSCKDDPKTEKPAEEATIENKVDENLFRVTLNATVLKDDSFQLYYREAESGNFEEANSLFVELKGSEQPQDIVFILPADAIPYYIRLDFGTNKEQQPIKVNDFKIEAYGRKFEAKGSEFFSYLLINESTMKKDVATSTVTPILTKEGTYDPITTSEKALFDQVQKLVQ